jgi:hypothetical protein
MSVSFVVRSLTTAGILFLSAMFISCGEKVNSDEIRAQLIQQRQEKDKYFQNDEHSPLTAEQRENFDGLNYFPVDLDYRIYTRIREYDSKDTITMVTTKEKEQQYLRWGEFSFSVENQRDTLHLYKPVHTDEGHPPYFFIPFYDETNNQSTYGGGRYLDIHVQQDANRYVIDFNRAYNPYCAYDYDRWSCPMPPLENSVDFKIVAGEQMYSGQSN